MDNDTEQFLRIIELEKKVTRLEANTVAIMQLVEMLAARLAELVPDVAQTPEDPEPENGAYL